MPKTENEIHERGTSSHNSIGGAGAFATVNIDSVKLLHLLANKRAGQGVRPLVKKNRQTIG